MKTKENDNPPSFFNIHLVFVTSYLFLLVLFFLSPLSRTSTPGMILKFLLTSY